MIAVRLAPHTQTLHSSLFQPKWHAHQFWKSFNSACKSLWSWTASFFWWYLHVQSLPIIWLWNSRLESCRQHHSHPPSCCQQQTAYPSLPCHLLALRQKLMKLWYSVWAAHCSHWYLGRAMLLLLLSASLHHSPTQHPGISLLPPASKEPHPCHFSPKLSFLRT